MRGYEAICNRLPSTFWSGRTPNEEIFDAEDTRCFAAVSRGSFDPSIAGSLVIGRTTLRGYLDRAKELGLSWPLPPEVSDTDLERLIYPRTARDVSNRAAPPDWAYIHRELRRKGVTLSLLWEEYRADHPEGYGYSRFCELYTRWEGKLSPVMRQRHLLPGR